MIHSVSSNSLDGILYEWSKHFNAKTGQVGNTKEQLFATTMLYDPCNVWMTHPERKHNVAVQIAETLWVLSGRSDMDYLSRFLPRARTWSDDGLFWRAGYGPRLREYTGCYVGTAYEHLPMSTDQIQMTVNKLISDPATRQAYISIWDPVKENMSTGSKDYPCNVGLQFISRKGDLNCCVFNRSNDLIWGLTGINVVEFSILQRLMASWAGFSSVGYYVHHSNSLHVYDSMFDRVSNIASTAPKMCADPKDISPRYNEPLKAPEVGEALALLEYFSDLEMLYRTDPLTARGELLGYVTDCYDQWHEFTLMFILPLFFDRPELKDTLKMFDLDCLHPLLKYNIIESDALKHKVAK